MGIPLRERGKVFGSVVVGAPQPGRRWTEAGATGLRAASSLIIEVTESANLSETPAALATLRTIKAPGARVAIDDFGTGYSTLATLSALPVDILKIPAVPHRREH